MRKHRLFRLGILQVATAKERPDSLLVSHRNEQPLSRIYIDLVQRQIERIIVENRLEIGLQAGAASEMPRPLRIRTRKPGGRTENPRFFERTKSGGLSERASQVHQEMVPYTVFRLIPKKGRER
ncbi:MAG: hypothetical protein V1787_05160 [Candidatus Micrarchaeota archaeon]